MHDCDSSVYYKKKVPSWLSPFPKSQPLELLRSIDHDSETKNSLHSHRGRLDPAQPPFRLVIPFLRRLLRFGDFLCNRTSAMGVRHYRSGTRSPPPVFSTASGSYEAKRFRTKQTAQTNHSGLARFKPLSQRNCSILEATQTTWLAKWLVRWRQLAGKRGFQRIIHSRFS
jgi:hypothetical protein